MHNEELHKLYSSPSIIRMFKSRKMRLEGHVARMGEKINTYRVLVRRPEGKEPLGRPRHGCEDNIKMDLREDWVVWTVLFWFGIGTSGRLYFFFKFA
jgi:hypothetical protein